MNALFGDGAEVFFWLAILGNEQDVAAERVRDTELQYPIGIKPGKVAPKFALYGSRLQ